MKINAMFINNLNIVWNFLFAIHSGWRLHYHINAGNPKLAAFSGFMLCFFIAFFVWAIRQRPRAKKLAEAGY